MRTVIVTKARLKKFTKITWLLAVSTTTPTHFLKVAGVGYSYLEPLNVISTLPAAVCIVLIGYFYVKGYLGVRQKKVNDIRRGAALSKEKLPKPLPG